MLASINNYKVKRLLLNGHYICSSDDGLQYLLCATKMKRSFRNYKLLQIQGIIFPNQKSFLSDGQGYECYPLQDKMSLCMTKLQSKSYSPIQITSQFLTLCKSIKMCLEHDLLKKEVLSCLSWDNLWIVDNSLILIWHQMRKDSTIYRDDVLLEKLMQILRMMHLTTRSKPKDNTLLRSIVAFMKSRPHSSPSLEEFTKFLTDLIPMKFTSNATNRRNSPPKTRKLLGKNRYSIQHTEGSLQKSLRFIKSTRKRTIDITDTRRYTKKLGKYSLFETIKKTASPFNSKSKQRSFSKDRVEHREDMDSIRTESSNLPISALLRTRAIQAFQNQKKKSIEASSFDPGKLQINQKGLTWREKFMKQKQSLTSSFKHKIRFHNKKQGQDRLMKLFKSNRQQYRVPLHIDISQTMNIEYQIPVERNYSDIKINQKNLQQTGLIINEEPSKLIEKRMRNEDLKTVKVQRSLFTNQNTDQKIDIRHIQSKQNSDKEDSFDQAKRQYSTLMATIQNQKTNKQSEHETRKQIQKSTSDAASVMVSETRILNNFRVKNQLQNNNIQKTKKETKQVKFKEFKQVKYQEMMNDDIQEIILENPKIKSMETQQSSKTQQSFKKKNEPIKTSINKMISEQLPSTFQQSRKISDAHQSNSSMVKTSKVKRMSSMKIRTESSEPQDKGVALVQSSVEQYVQFINLMGEAVSKSQKVCKSFVDIQWFTGIYFIYKRFLRQRIKIQTWLQDGVCEFRRSFQNKIDPDSFERWLSTQSRNNILKKIRDQNTSISQSIKKMNKNLIKKTINSKIIEAAELQTQSPKQSSILLEHVINQFDELMERQMTQEVKQHLIQILDAAFIIAELDQKGIQYRVDFKHRKSAFDFNEYFICQQKHVDELAKAYNIQ